MDKPGTLVQVKMGKGKFHSSDSMETLFIEMKSRHCA